MGRKIVSGIVLCTHLESTYYRQREDIHLPCVIGINGSLSTPDIFSKAFIHSNSKLVVS